MPFIDIVEWKTREEGVEEGHRKGIVQVLSLLFRTRFGKAGAEAAAELAEINDLQILEEVALGLDAGKTLEDLRAIWNRNA